MAEMAERAETIAKRFATHILNVLHPNFVMRNTSRNEEVFIFGLNLPDYEGNHSFGDKVIISVYRDMQQVAVYPPGFTTEQILRGQKPFVEYYTVNDGRNFTKNS
jgi:hypothetical protein